MQAIASKDDLHSFIRSLNTEICRIWEHWNVLNGIHQSAGEYSLEMNDSSQFWRIISRSLQDVVLVRLAAALDLKEDVVSMPNLLRLLQQQVDPSRAVVPITQGMLDIAKIADDIKAVGKDKEVVSKVRRLRNKVVGHRDMSIVVRDAMHELPELPDAEIDRLIKALHDMVWKYSRMLGIGPIVLSFPGQDDYKSLFRLLRAGFKAG